MKKAIALLMGLILVAALSAPALAAGSDLEVRSLAVGLAPDEGQYQDGVYYIMENSLPDAGALYARWEESGYPDDVGGVYYDNDTGKMVISLVGATEARREEIRSMLEDPDSAAFDTAAYAYNDMMAILQEIQSGMSAESGVRGAGIGWKAGEDGEALGFGESGKEFRVVVTVDPGMLPEYTESFSGKYGDMVYVQAGEPFLPLDSGGPSANDWLFPIALAFLCLTAFGVWFARSRRMLVMQTASGGTVAAARPLGRREVVRAVKENAISPDDSVYEAVMKKIER